MSNVPTEAWVTSAMEDGAAEKALILASSLRRVKTAKMMVVLTTSSVSAELRRKLKYAFDDVRLLEQNCPKHWNLEDFAKAQALSLGMFGKCVYLSPNTMVLRNCDEVFRKYSTFAVSYIIPKNDAIDASVFLFTPNLKYDGIIGEPVSYAGFQERFIVFLKNNMPALETLDGQYNMRLNMMGKPHQISLVQNSAIFNFTDVHPVDLSPEFLENTAGQFFGAVEKFAMDECLKIYLEDVKKSAKCTESKNNKYAHEPIAIVGMSFRLPGSNNEEEFWSMLAEGKNAIIPLPTHRWTKDHSYFPCYSRKVEAGFLSIPVDEFDGKFFGLSPKEVEFLDPQQRLLMEVTWEALEDAMIDPLKLNGTQTGMFVGTWVHDYKDMLSRSVDPDFFRTYMGNSIGSSAARLSHFFGTTGPSIATESGCSAAIAAVDMACKSLRNGVSNMALAAGANLLLHPFEPSMMEYVLSQDFRCKTFDANANGFARAEACAVLVLKRLSDALSDGDNIWGLIRGTALTQEGISRSLGTPTVHCESLAMEMALKDAGVDPKDVSYIEAHGTGTAVGDPMEILAIEKAYSKGRTSPLLIGSVKTNVGHTESVSGITGIIKVLLSLKNEMIPKHLNLETLNPQINLETIPAQIPLEAMPWPRTEEKRRIAGVSSFGISGTDGHAIIEEPPHNTFPPQLVMPQKRPLHLMKISAKSAVSMNELIQKYLNIFNEKIEKNEDFEADFANIAYSANIGRATHTQRGIIIAKNFTEAAKQLKENSFPQSEIQSSGSSLCFLFTGQGSQYPNMAKQLYESSPVFKDSFDLCDAFLRNRYDIFIKNVLWTESGKHEELNRTLYSQTSIFVVEYSLLQLWTSWGIKPDYVMGHSLGEFAAAVAAGALGFEDALRLVAERSQLIDNLPRGKMLVIRADKKTVQGMIEAFQKIQQQFWADFAAINSPDQTVVAGDSEMIEEFSRFCRERSLKTIVLAASHAFHSRHMDPMLEAYRKVAAGMTFGKPKVKKSMPKFISGTQGCVVDVNSINTDYWVRHTREPVRFIEACKVVQQQGCTLFLEVGPHPVLSALVMMNSEGHSISCLPSIRREEGEWKTMLDSLSKLYLSTWKGEIDWKGFDRFYGRNKVKLPFYPFNRKPVWTRVDSAYPKIHPLIGSIIPTASTETIFQNSLTLKNAPFAQDHMIGNTVVFPGAGFLEMCLVGGLSTVQGFTEGVIKPRRPILLKSLKISSPLALYESETCKVQTLVSLRTDEADSELGYSVTVSRHADRGNGAGKWIEHASAKFLPIAPPITDILREPIDIPRIQASWTKGDNRDFYDNLVDVGLRFGPKFRSLEMGWNSDKAALIAIKVPEDYKEYLIHPVVADAMIQGFMLWTSRDGFKKKLQVPVQIGEFVWLKEAESATQFVYSSTDNDNNVYCVLVDETGSPLACMKNIDCVETTVKLVEGMITQQSTTMPMLWEEVWKPTRGPMQGYLIHEGKLEDLDFSLDELNYFEEKNKMSAYEQQFYVNLVKLTRFAVLKALCVLGWKPKKMEEFSVDMLIKGLKIKASFKQYIQFFMKSLAKEECGMVEAVGNNSFRFLEDPQSISELEEVLKYVPNPENVTREEYKLSMELERNLSKILTGQVDPLSILFPEDSINKPCAAKFYDHVKLQQTTKPVECKIASHVAMAEQHYLRTPLALQGRPTYRCLEIGAGTGMFTKDFVKDILPKACKHSDFEFYMTDISQAFFSAAEKLFQDQLKSIVFKLYDMDKDPLEQGLCPEYFDMICAGEVLHVAKDVKKTMKLVRSLLKPGGLIIISETMCPDEKITFVFGLLPGYWNFADKEFRKDHITMTPDMWKEALAEADFHGVTVTPMYGNIHATITAYAAPQRGNTILQNVHPPTRSWIIFGDDDLSDGLQQRILKVNRKCHRFLKPAEFTESYLEKYFQNAITSASEDVQSVIEGIIYLWSLSPNSRDQRMISLPYMTLMKLVQNLKPIPKTFVVTRGVSTMETSDVINPTSGTLMGLSKALANENLNFRNTCLDLDPNNSPLEQINELFMNLWVEHKQQSVAFRHGLRLCPKLASGKIPRNEPLTLPGGCDRFQLVLPTSKLIADLEFAYLEPYTIAENEVEIHVKAMALNFRDVLTVLKPIAYFENFNTVGLDFVGVVSRIGGAVTQFKIGDRVMGMNMGDGISLPSHLKVPADRIAALPSKMTFAEGVTLPAVLFTAVHCLLDVAKMKKGETVLVHTASGGVGLLAIQLCQYVGAHIIATAGSRGKRSYLKNLGIQHVFHSRTTDFKADILKVTQGRGVDIVLNSITGPGFKEASMDVLTKNGRFIEMSKLNVWEKEVKEFRPDVSYHLVDLTQLESWQHKHLHDRLKEFTKSGVIKPIAYERFDALNIRGALNYLQKAKHIGKIVVVMPEVHLEKSKLIATTPLFNPDSTYLVTGGLGGIGFAVVRWMLDNNAKHIVIVSRSVRPKPEVGAQIENFNNDGKHVEAFSVDVGNYDMLKELFENLKKPDLGFPPMRGVMHVAGVLDDGILENQSWSKFEHTYNPKVTGSWNLHDLTKDYHLEHFVLFSSIAATLGTPGQTNHSASNSFEDCLAAYRRSIGLPATSVNWGNWGEVGVATEIDFPGFRPISTAQGLIALETFLKTQTRQMCVLNIDSFSLALKFVPHAKHYLDDSRLLGDSNRNALIMNSVEFWNGVDSAQVREEKVECFKKLIKSVVRTILKMDGDEPIDDQAEFTTVGIDSLMMLEMKNGMQNILAGRMTLTANQLKDCNNTEVLANTLVDILEGNQDESVNILSHEEFKELIRHDSNLLPETLSIQNLKCISIDRVQTVLLTGATGNLGPYLLRDLSQMGQIKMVYCLVRQTRKQTAMERLKARLQQVSLKDEVDFSKVEVIDGDIASNKFGLSDEDYSKLCGNVEAVVHSAVRADHTAKYWKVPETRKSHVRTVNVLGTLHLLEFAAEGKLKHFFHASTLLAFTGMGKDGEFSEGWQSVQAFDTLEGSSRAGYFVTKHICEQLVYRAIEKGIPCKAFRFPVIAGDGRTGRVDYQQNHVLLRWLTCMKVGAIHDQPYPVTGLSVDLCSKISLGIFFNPQAPLDVYNLLQKGVDVEQVIVEVAQYFGIDVEVVSYQDFIDKLKAEDENSPVAAFIKLYIDLGTDMSDSLVNPSSKALMKYVEEGRNFLDTSKLSKYYPDYDNSVESMSQVLIRDFTFLKNSGVFEKFGIKTAS